jgi:hypothetical protein
MNKPDVAGSTPVREGNKNDVNEVRWYETEWWLSCDGHDDCIEVHGHADRESALRFSGRNVTMHGAVHDRSPGEIHADECIHDGIHEGSHDDDDQMHGRKKHGRTYDEIHEESHDDDDQMHGFEKHGFLHDEADERSPDDDLLSHGRTVHGREVHGFNVHGFEMHGRIHDELHERSSDDAHEMHGAMHGDRVQGGSGHDVYLHGIPHEDGPVRSPDDDPSVHVRMHECSVRRTKDAGELTPRSTRTDGRIKPFFAGNRVSGTPPWSRSSRFVGQVVSFIPLGREILLEVP